MTWLLALYPPRWRRRYGEELRTLLREQSFSPAIVIDLVAGAIDAWLAPQSITWTAPEVAGGAEGGRMIGRMMKLSCAGYGARVTKEDGRKSAAVMLGGTILLTLPWMWLRFRLPDNDYVDAFAAMPFLIPYLASLRYSSLKGRSPRTQAIFMGGTLLFLTVLAVVVGWIASRI
jgi:hypothetical protein